MPADPAVVDASALAALLFGEAAGSEVAEGLADRPLFAPDLLRYEVASVCRKKAAAEPGKEKALRSALRLLPRLGIQEVRVPSDALVAVSAETRLTVYDAAYLWVARELGAELVTLDGRLRAAGI